MLQLGEVATMKLGEVATMMLGKVFTMRLGEVATMRQGEVATKRLGEAALMVEAVRTLPWCYTTSKMRRMELAKLTVMILPRHGLVMSELSLLELPVAKVVNWNSLHLRIVRQRWNTERIFVFFVAILYGIDGLLDF